MRALTFRERLREEEAKAVAAELADPWRLRLERVRGKVDFFDKLERISSQTLLDLLDVPQRNRTAATFRRVAKIMAELGWAAVSGTGFDARRIQRTGSRLLPGSKRSASSLLFLTRPRLCGDT